MNLKAIEDRQAPVTSSRGQRFGKGITLVASPRLRRVGHPLRESAASTMLAPGLEANHFELYAWFGKTASDLELSAGEARPDSWNSEAASASPRLAAALEDEDEDEDVDDLDEDDEDEVDEDDEDLEDDDEEDDEEFGDDEDDLDDDDLDEDDEDEEEE